MSYNKSSGKPFEYASKISHRHLILDEEIQKYISECIIPFEGKDVELNPNLIHDIVYPSKNKIENIIAVDGGYSTIAIKKKFPSSLITYFQFGSLLIKRKDLEQLASKPFISPKDMAKLKELSPDKLVLPTKNLLLKGQSNFTFAVRKVIYDFFLNKDKNKDNFPLIDTLRWFLFKNYESTNISSKCDCQYQKDEENSYLHICTLCNNKAYQLSKCPRCSEPNILLKEEKMDKLHYTWECSNSLCDEKIFLTDVFRIFEAVDNDLGAGGVLGYILSVVENLLLVHIMRVILDNRHGFLNEFLLVKDGPLSFVGQTANMYKPMRAFLNYVSINNNLNLIGIEKSGAFVDHAKEISHKLKSGQVLLLNKVVLK